MKVPVLDELKSCWPKTFFISKTDSKRTAMDTGKTGAGKMRRPKEFVISVPATRLMTCERYIYIKICTEIY